MGRCRLCVIAGTPLTAKAHVGHSGGNDGSGPNGTSLTSTGSFTDWSLGVDAFKNLTLGVAHVDTDICVGRRLPPARIQQGQRRNRPHRGPHRRVLLTAAF